MIYYNEIDPYCAQWLRNLMINDLIPEGDVDERSIEDVRPADVRGYHQCHFFAGVGGWPLALRLAGWPDSRLVWTGSCPCQPFSQAGKGKGFTDERHLWPAFFWLIQQCSPGILFGEQVSSPAGLAWLDLVFNDLESIGHACGAVDLPAASLGAPHTRQRLFWLANTSKTRQHRRQDAGTDRGNEGARSGEGPRTWDIQPERDGTPRGLADADGRNAKPERLRGNNEQRWRAENDCAPNRQDCPVRSAQAWGMGLPHGGELSHAAPAVSPGTGWIGGGGTVGSAGSACHPWRELEWIECLDGKRRPTEPGIFPLAARLPGDVAKLRAYGNAIVPQVAAEVIRLVLDCAP